MSRHLIGLDILKIPTWIQKAVSRFQINAVLLHIKIKMINNNNTIKISFRLLTPTSGVWYLAEPNYSYTKRKCSKLQTRQISNSSRRQPFIAVNEVSHKSKLQTRQISNSSRRQPFVAVYELSHSE